MFNYSLIAAALLSAAFGTAVGKSATVAGAVALVGFIVALSFILIDGRNRWLVRIGEDVLVAVEKEIFANTGFGMPIANLPPGILALDRAERPIKAGYPKNYLWGKHGVHLRWIQTVLAFMFLCGAITAFKCPELLDGTDHDTKISIGNLQSEISTLQTTIDDANRRSDTMAMSLHQLQESIDRGGGPAVESNPPDPTKKAKRLPEKGRR